MQKRRKLADLSISGAPSGTWLLIALVALHLCCATSYALELAILDCHGTTRAVRKVEPLSKSEVKVNVTDANGEKIDGQELKLQSVDGAQTISAKVVQGTVVFPEVPQGMWILSSENPAVYFTSISLSESLAAGVAVGIASAGIAGGGAALTAGVIEVNDIVNPSKNDQPAATPVPTPQPPIPTPPAPQPTIVPPVNCVACDPEQEAPELPDFFESVEAGTTPISPSF